jgi:3-hydroxybutyryl-CoA dehydrogenase
MFTIKTIGVCGAGTMGSGIAQIAAQSGFATVLFDLNEDVLQKSKSFIQKNLQSLVEKQKINIEEKEEIFNRIHFTSNINNCMADLIVEAIIENKNAKVDLFKKLQSINKPETLLATNTSSISITSIAEELNTFRHVEQTETSPENKPVEIEEISRQEPRNDSIVNRFAGMHFFNPAQIMKLVEIITTDKTNKQVVEALITVCKQMNKTAVVCKDAPGFIVNRVARHYYLEAMKLVELNLATIENIDAIMEATGFKMGPFKLMDLIGMDINYSVSNIVWNDLGKPERLKPSLIQKQKVKANELGRKTDKGFYNYS